MDTLSDPSSLADREDVDVEETETTVGAAEFAQWTSLSGLVAVGVPDGDGQVLLMDGANGWALPNQPVAPGEDWVGVAERTIDQLTGVEIQIDGVERVREIEYVREDDADSRTTVHHVVFAAETIDDAVAADLVGGVEADLPSVDWFDVPPAADREAGDVDADVGLFVD